MESDRRLPTGEWSGFYLENHQPRRGWMHLYMSFDDGKIKGEGTDYVGPWLVAGDYDLATGICTWVKQYLGKHQVIYRGTVGENGITGQWEISFLTGEFHIWPKSLRHLDELYLADDLSQPQPSTQLGSVSFDKWLA
jgi:hypothetical protein